MVDQLAAMTGLSEAEASQYMEMAGGDVEGAINLFFSMSGGGFEGGASEPSSDSNWPEYAKLVFSGALGEAWKQQGLVFGGGGSDIGLVQELNGPCGVLAAIHAMLIAQRLDASKEVCGKGFEEAEIASVLSRIIRQCGKDKDSLSVCLWEGENEDLCSRKVSANSVDAADVEQFVLANLAQFTAPGGLLLLVFSCVNTRGADAISMDIACGGGEPPLIVGPNHLCTSELVMFILCGVAKGSVGAYNSSGSKWTLDVPSGVGLLSFMELDSGIPVNDTLKSPRLPVWIVHSGDHFTVLFADRKLESLFPPLELWHYNGLRPGGPRLAKIQVLGSSVLTEAPESHKDIYFKPVIGEIEDIVQADESDKAMKKGKWTEWKYEVVLAVEDLDVQGQERTANMPPAVTFEQGVPDESEKWRCSWCYRNRFKTMCFGQNPPGVSKCQHCEKPREYCGWTLWKRYEELPREWKTKMDRRYAPKVVSLFQTKWPGCSLTLVSSSTSSTDLPTV
mmetsp:Transcript_7588/g.12263  ORF Transcript_7588/g.12263 Transcript_7588/m.12263 type:complete len:506 (+) Transcript_7588:249-1766(+)